MELTVGGSCSLYTNPESTCANLFAALFVFSGVPYDFCNGRCLGSIHGILELISCKLPKRKFTNVDHILKTWNSPIIMGAVLSAVLRTVDSGSGKAQMDTKLP